MEGLNYNYRYGKFPFSRPFVIVFLLFCLITIGVVVFEKASVLFLFPNMFMCWRFASPYFEKFYFDNDRIVTWKFKNHEVIDVPENAILVISYTMLKQSIVGKQCYSVNIVDENIDTILEKLHADDRACEWIAYHHKIKKLLIYDNIYIESIFKNRVVYSFVYNNETQQIFNDLKRTVILPRSLASNISIEENGFDVIIDEGR